MVTVGLRRGRLGLAGLGQVPPKLAGTTVPRRILTNHEAQSHLISIILGILFLLAMGLWGLAYLGALG